MPRLAMPALVAFALCLGTVTALAADPTYKVHIADFLNNRVTTWRAPAEGG